MAQLKQIVFWIKKKMNSFKIIRFFYIYHLTFLILFLLPIQAGEVKIVKKIGKEIITNIDVEDEYNYLVTLNRSLKDIDKNQVISFAQNSLIKEKIKKNEILKYYDLNNKNQTIDLMIENIYKNLGLNTKEEFQIYLTKNNLNFDSVYKKIEIEAIWNQMIYEKFKDKIFIDEEKLKNKILNNQKEIESLHLSEIVIDLKNKNEMSKKYSDLLDNINKNGFEASVLKFSISNSKSNSGLIGWINTNSLSKIIQKALSEIEIGDITKPILVSSGMLILRLNDKKSEESNTDFDSELNKKIEFEMNNQLNNFSRIYYDKIKVDFL